MQTFRSIEYGDLRLRDEVWKNIYPEPNTDCWLWGGYINDDGYGRGSIVAQGRLVMAHRITFETLVRPLVKGEELDHLCRVRACCKPEHVDPVSHAVNVMRGNSFSAINARKTHCLRGHEYVEGSFYRPKNGGRLCKACHKIQQANHAKRQAFKQLVH